MKRRIIIDSPRSSSSPNSPKEDNSNKCKRRRTNSQTEDNEKSLLTFIDTHCHLDFLFDRLKFKGTFSEYVKSANFPPSYEGCVAIFCNPATLKNKSMWTQFLEEDKVWGAFGCHPHNANDFDEEAEKYLKKALKHEKVVALGEIGLDYSDRNEVDPSIQKLVFRKQLEIAVKKELPIVIHSRDSTDDTLEIMKELVPLNHKIHRHCFTSNWQEAQVWLENFPNLCLGITNVVNYKSAKEVHDTARNIPLDRLLLETDTPYFGFKSKLSNPGNALQVADKIAQLRGIDVDEILHHARINTVRIYSI